jgi:hypothetical protein
MITGTFGVMDMDDLSVDVLFCLSIAFFSLRSLVGVLSAVCDGTSLGENTNKVASRSVCVRITGRANDHHSN